MKSKFLAFLFIVAVAFASCSNEDSREKKILESACEQIMGTYTLDDFALTSPISMDLDADGVSSGDLMKELFGLRLCEKRIKTDRARVKAAEAFDVETESLLFIPVQNLIYDKQYDIFTKTDGESIYIPFVYSVTKDGDIELKLSDKLYFGSAYDDMGVYIRGYDLKYTKTKSIDVPSPGTIVLEMECGYYDFASNKFRTCSVVFRYGRVSYSDRIQ